MRNTILAALAVCPCVVPTSAQAPCPGDLNADRMVDGNDLGILLGAWGACTGCVSDINADGYVNGGDLGLLLSAWGACRVITPAWATLVETAPNPAVITDPTLRQRIIATGLAWRVRDTATQIELLLVPRGTFDMGCSPTPQGGCNPDENPVHAVTLGSSFYLGRFEVTQAQWTSRMGSNPSWNQGYSDSVSRPVERVSWNTVQTFFVGTGLRLPTEAEWEYACRAGTVTALHNGSNDGMTATQVAWCIQNNGAVGTPSYGSKPVGLLQANRLGLHDMHGNVWEWVSDWYGAADYASSPELNPTGPSSGSNRVMRGGCWGDNGLGLRASARGVAVPGLVDLYVGFRVARHP